ncbi:MAG: S8 family serine peptidase [Candidatus Brocadiales bacterium]|nr:S8 family serine peptidase [Candidatus Brocadiales bacterium]
MKIRNHKTTCFLIGILLVSTAVYADQVTTKKQNYHDEHASEQATFDGGKDIHFGKISAELMDQVYRPGWRKNQFVFLPGIQSQDYDIEAKLFLEKPFKKIKGFVSLGDREEIELISKNKEDTEIVIRCSSAKLLTLNELPGVIAIESPAIKQLQFHGNPAPFIVKRSNPVFLEKAGVHEAWEKWGRGKGVKIGIIDGGFININSLFEADILPENRVTIRNPLTGESTKKYPLGTGIHGSAVTEVVHEIAPEADIYLYPTALKFDGWENAINMAIKDGVHILTSSLNSTDGALDGIGTPNVFIDRAVEAGILYFNSAGNNTCGCYISNYQDLDGNGWHNFSRLDEGNTVYLKKGETITVSLYWDDYGTSPQIPNATQDLDLYLFYTNPINHQSYQVSKSAKVQSADNVLANAPAETFTLKSAPATGNYSVMIKGHDLDPNRMLKMRLFVEGYDADSPSPNIYKSIQYISRNMTMTKPADHPGVFTVAAAGLDHNVHEYSGTGPTENGAKKPDITAYAGLETSSMQDPFFGTSCASPFAAGCAALLWQSIASPTAEKVKAELINRAIDLCEEGHDFSSGWGLIQLMKKEKAKATKASIQEASKKQETNSTGLPGFNYEVSFTCQNSKGKHIFAELLFKDENGKFIPHIPDDNYYVNSKGNLCIRAYLIPSTQEEEIYQLPLFIPYALTRGIPAKVQVIVQLTNAEGKVLDSKVMSKIEVHPLKKE